MKMNIVDCIINDKMSDAGEHLAIYSIYSFSIDYNYVNVCTRLHLEKYQRGTNNNMGIFKLCMKAMANMACV